MSKLKNIFLPLFFILPALSFGQDEVAEKSLFEQYQVELVLALAVVVCFVLLLAMYTMYVAMKAILQSRNAEQGIEEEKRELIPAIEGEEGVGFWRRFWNRVNASVPVTREAEVATSHEYDGIRELDNKMPPWWLYGFYASIIFAVIYFFYFTILGTGPTQDEEFRAEMIQADQEVKVYLASLSNLIDESNVVLSTESADINAGRATFEANCAVCHAADGGGGVGPNMTDKFWLHGGDMPSIFKTIKYGVPSKGMISWETQLSPKKMMQVASYIYLMEGQTAANPKEPQGELFKRVAETEESNDDNSESDVEYVDDEANLEDGECC